MHPAISVIFFTVVSGAGYGLMALVTLSMLFKIDGGLDHDQVLVGGTLAMILITVGLMSSSLHLANPKNAWRSMSRFRTSWLSREAVLAISFYPMAALWLLQWYLDSSMNNLFTLLLTFLLFAGSIAVNFATGMLYASLKTIPQWNTSLVPANYIMLGLMLGSLLLTLLRLYYGLPIEQLLTINVGLIATAGTLKIMYYFWVGKPHGPSINTATAFTRATVRLFDVGHTSGTFLTDEFGYQVARFKILLLRWVVYLAAFLLPGTFIAYNLQFDSLMVILAIAFIGVFVERWLFFAEARHVVTLYHGNQRV
jgi:DMSO reductase anchor subunit